MYAFKIVTSTLLVLFMAIVLYVGATSNGGKNKLTALMIFCIEAMGVIAIWG